MNALHKYEFALKGNKMKKSTERILTTHTGSLPRPQDLLDMLFKQERGEAVDQDAFEARVRDAVHEVVRKQISSGIDIVNDGEMGKISYSTYVKDRLTGYEGTAPLKLQSSADMADFPEFTQRRTGGISEVIAPVCNGPITYTGQGALQQDIDNFKAALVGVDVVEAFMTAASPGVISIFLPNQYYPTDEAYLYALADAMKEEYETIYRAGFILQLDCPDLTAIRNIGGTQSNESYIALHVEALNYALRDIPPERMRLHLCWGNYEGPHHKDMPLRSLIDTVLKARPVGLSFEGANPRHEHEWNVFQDVKLPDGKVIIPGVLDSTTNFIEHPELVAQRIERYAALVGRENVIAGTDCGFATFAGMYTVDPRITWAKLQSMSEGAQIASRELW
jgi:5-methyltetrahydropteroyltriglutamate--homocysteine methyltransferase